MVLISKAYCGGHKDKGDLAQQMKTKNRRKQGLTKKLHDILEFVFSDIDFIVMSRLIFIFKGLVFYET